MTDALAKINDAPPILSAGIHRGYTDSEYRALPYVCHSDLQAFAVGETGRKISNANAQAGNLAELFALDPTKYATRYFTLPDDRDEEGHQKHPFNTSQGKTWLLEETKKQGSVAYEAVRFEHHRAAVRRGEALKHSKETGAFFQCERHTSVVVIAKLCGVTCKSQLDMELLRDGSVTIGDIKTTSMLSAVEFNESIIKYGYASQAAMYCDLYSVATEIAPENFYNIVVSKTAHDDDGVPVTWRVRYTSQMLAFGRQWYETVLNLKGRLDATQ